MSETTRPEEGDALTAKKQAKESDVKVEVSPVLARLIEEVRQEKAEGPQAYNRMHNRHNRSR